MKPSLSLHLKRSDALLADEQGRRRLVTVALNIAQGTPLAPKQYERMLLDQFVRGTLTLDEITALLEKQEYE